MRLREFARSSWLEIKAHKARSAMTCLSLAVGVAAMLFTFSQTGGTMRRYREALELAGPGRLNASEKQGYVSRGRSPGLTLDDAAEIRRLWPELYMVSPVAERRRTRLRWGAFTNEGVRTLGVTPEWRRRDWVYALRGRFLNDRDLREAARVCVLVKAGGWVKKPFWAKYFPDQALTQHMKRHDALGRQILIEDKLFTVVGILQEPPRDRDPRWFHRGGGDGTVLVPITAYQRCLLPRWTKNPASVYEIGVDTGDERTAGLTLRRVERLLAARHRGEPDFEIKDFRQLMQGALKEIRQFILSILIIGIVAVLASGIGIMNVTLATIFSRVREIGIRRALGATRSDIVLQFVSEAMVLGLVGGAAGAGLGVAGICLLAPRAERMEPIGAAHVAAALAVALGTGLLFSLYPAYKASRFDPVEALHYE